MTASGLEFPGRQRSSALRRTTALLLGVGAATALLLGSGVAPAAAHDGLVSTSPAADATLDTAPPEIQLRFSGPPLPLGTEVVVAGPDGADIAEGPAEIRDTAVVQQLAGTPAPGRYTVQWRSTSSDGHPLSGSYTFTVTGSGPPPVPAPAAAATPLPEVPAAPLVEAAAAERSDGSGAAIGWVAAGVVVLGALGVLLARRLRGRA
ncbi:copper resistance CopC family protein [Blastococcus saxobsidens]|uniref:Copper resistance protein n=1 Tax=Blastococcus saxobsidens (strain DD2) TaxID=1146883 RepID=H6RJQ8_BLASD|nr:copper resistance CopC family protein [Blastococcus saxobsidens]CCG03561.1 Copper resistance protein [Blastococcus saxobsidens DD2]